MPGSAKTSQVLLSTATVMIGGLSDLHGLHPTAHSIGLVKNVSVQGDPQFTELTQGIANDVVMSVKTGDGVRVSFEVYEFTLRNLAYAAGLDGSGVAYDPIAQTYNVNTASGTSVVCASTPTGIAAGDYIFVQEAEDDVVHIAKVASIATNTITLAAGFAIPAGMTFTNAARVGKVKRVDIGGSLSQPEVSVKIVGLLPKNNHPVTILLPKAKITKGLGVSFSSDNFASMPFELTPYAGVPGDPFYNDYGTKKMVLFPR